MHPNPIYRQTDEQLALSFVKETGFGVLTVNGPDAPLLAHVPFYVSGSSVYLHLVRSNPIARQVKADCPAIIAVSGAHGYVSPDWYGMDDQVPTWNYIAIHLKGRIAALPQADLAAILDHLSDEYENRIDGKAPWTRDKMSSGAFEKMMRSIQPFRFDIESVESTFKLAQNKPEAARIGAAEIIEFSPLGTETQKLAQIMRNLPTGSEIQ